MSVQRWQFEDLVTPETWTHPVNPNTAGSPFAARTLTFARGGRGSDGDADGGIRRLRVMETPAQPTDWQFGGVIYTQEHHDELLRWANKSNQIRVSDHLGRTFEVIIRSFRPTERRPTPTNEWRMTYAMNVLVLRRVA